MNIAFLGYLLLIVCKLSSSFPKYYLVEVEDKLSDRRKSEHSQDYSEPKSYIDNCKFIDDICHWQGDSLVKKTFRVGTENLWPNATVPYTLSSNFTAEQKDIIVKQAMKTFEDNTCLKFVEATNEKTWLSFVSSKTPGPCWASSGKQEGERQLGMADWCFVKAHILHELMHALGFMHENERSDRDEYVTFHNGLTASYFNDSNVDLLGTPYDYCSIVHPTFNKTDYDQVRNKIISDLSSKSIVNLY